MIRIDEGEAETGGEPLPDRRLARSHQPDKDDGAINLP
jgi:hypothetical protein